MTRRRIDWTLTAALWTVALLLVAYAFGCGRPLQAQEPVVFADSHLTEQHRRDRR